MKKILIGVIIIFIILGYFAYQDYNRPANTKEISYENPRESLSTYAAVFQGVIK